MRLISLDFEYRTFTYPAYWHTGVDRYVLKGRVSSDACSMRRVAFLYVLIRVSKFLRCCRNLMDHHALCLVLRLDIAPVLALKETHMRVRNSSERSRDLINRLEICRLCYALKTG